MDFSSKQWTPIQIACINKRYSNYQSERQTTTIQKHKTKYMISNSWNRLSIEIPVFSVLMQGLHIFMIFYSRMKHMTSKESLEASKITPTFEGNSVAFHQFLFPSLVQIKQLTIIIINLQQMYFHIRMKTLNENFQSIRQRDEDGKAPKHQR